MKETYFDNLGDLLRAWRKSFNLSQESLAEKIGVSSRELRRWEASGEKQTIPGHENLEDLAEATGIPLGVILSLAARLPIPVFYTLRKRRYSYSPGAVDIPFTDSFTLHNEEPSAQNPIGRVSPIQSDAEATRILEYDHGIYPTDNGLKKSVILKAAEILPQFNLFVTDTWGHYAGHLVILPVSESAYSMLTTRKMEEGDIEMRDLRHQDQEFSLYAYSLYACRSAIAHLIFRHVIRWSEEMLDRSGDHKIAGYSVTKDGLETTRHFGFETVYKNPKDKETMNLSITPTMSVGRLSNLVASKKNIRIA